jgi:ubiquinone/menaquinone biosynthesis C-methylase UbiE
MNTTTRSEKLPAYESELRAFHDALRPELEAAIGRYKTPNNGRVLDLACGDGFYSALFARQMTGGELIAVDHSPAYLRAAKHSVHRYPNGPTVRFIRSDSYRLPFEDESFDLIWCAQSMISLAEPVKALREMGRVLKSTGRVVILETDEFRHVLLPWPVSLEVAIQRALRDAGRQRYGTGSKLAPARRLRSFALKAGLTPTRTITVAADRQAPFDRDTQVFLVEHFSYLRKLVRPSLTARQGEFFDRFTSESDAGSLFRRADGEFTCLATLFHARRPTK